MKFVGPSSSQNLVAQKREISARFRKLRDLDANFSGMQQDIVNVKTALQTADTTAQANLIWLTLIHERLKTGPEF